MRNNAIDIDLVYLWVDGSDPAWQAKHNAFIGKTEENSSVNCKGRYANNDELKYSLRSVEKYAPWIRKIFIVTDNQVPAWLDASNPRIKIIDHTEIMPAESLPCFNSALMEDYLYRIPGLAEHFLYANDDMFINKEVTAADFFNKDGFPIIRLKRKLFRRIRWFWREKIRKKKLDNYYITIAHASRLVEKRYGTYYTGMPHHNIDAYLKSDYKRTVEEIMPDEFSANIKNRKRTDNDIQRVVFSYVALAEKHGQLHYVTKKESMHVMIYKQTHYELLNAYCPYFFCMNDSEFATDNDRLTAQTYLEKRFPDKSEFEK